MRHAVGVGVHSDYRASWINAQCMSSDRRRKIDGAVSAGGSQETVEHACAVFKVADDIGTRVDVPSLCERTAGHIK